MKFWSVSGPNFFAFKKKIGWRFFKYVRGLGIDRLFNHSNLLIDVLYLTSRDDPIYFVRFESPLIPLID